MKTFSELSISKLMATRTQNPQTDVIESETNEDKEKSIEIKDETENKEMTENIKNNEKDKNN